jgi:predicted Zn finger-like uncharacterized protein
MRVVCPHCTAAYNVDDKRVPPAGLTVRCPKCQQTFPVRPTTEAAGQRPGSGGVPLPSPSLTRTTPGGGVPLPPPSLARTTPGGGVPLPSPPGASPSTPAFAAADADSPFGEDPDFAASPFGDAHPAGGPSPFDAGPSAFDAGPVTGHPAATDPTDLGGAPAAATPLSFGEVDFEASPDAPAAGAEPIPDPFAVPAPPEDPFTRLEPPAPPAPSIPPPVVSPAPSAVVAGGIPAGSGEELENLFGEGGPGKKLSGWRVRRRSGRIFGPFDEAQVVEMLEKGELLGNEDVALMGSDAWKSIGQVKAFGDAMRKVAGTPPPIAKKAISAFGDRMAAAEQVTEAASLGGGLPRGLVPAIGGGLLLLLLVGGGIAAGRFTPYGYFFTGLLRGGDPAAASAFTARARAELAKGDFASLRAAHDLAQQAVGAAPGSADALALSALTASALEAQHAAPPGALDLARKAAEKLADDAKGEPEALAARLAISAADAPAGTTPQETALDQAAAKRKPDPDLLALLGRAALGRGDAARAATIYGRLDAAEPKGPRGPLGAGVAAARKGDLAAARVALEKALARAPGHLPSRLELAALEVSAGAAAAAEPHLAALLGADAEGKLSPLEKARALSLRAALLGRRGATAAEAEATWEKALEADPRAVEPRLALARHRLRRGDAARATEALDPLAATAAQNPPVAALRVRALAGAGRALDAISLADAALSATPGEPQVLLAKAAALEAAGRNDEAGVLYQDAAARAPASFEPRLALARLALARHELPGAATEIAAALEKGPREPAVQVVAGDVALAGNDVGGAEAAYKKALALDAETAGAEVGIARLALTRGDRAAATAGVERALAIEPRNGDAQALHGGLLWTAGDLAGAERALSVAVELQPRNAQALMNLGAVKLERGDADGAILRLTSASNEEPDLAPAHRWLGRALLARNEVTTAITQLRRAAELQPKDTENQLQLGIGLERSGALEEAVDAFKAAAAAAPTRPEGNERLAQLYATNNRCDLAVPAWEKAIATAPRVWRYRVALGDCKLKLNKHQDALRIFREVLKAQPGAVAVHYKLARAVHEAEGAHAAFPYYERAAREEKDNPMPHYYLGFAYKERGQKQRAVQEFKRFLELKPDADEKKDIEAEIEDLGG